MKRLYSLLFLFSALTGCNKAHKMGVKPIVESVYESTSYTQSPDLSYLSQAQTAVKEQVDVYPACLTSYEGHKATFRLIDGKWVAIVRENLPDGFINQVQLPVCVDSGITMEQLLDATPDFQKRHIHIIFPNSSKDKEGLVYIGNVGLKGGGPVSSRLYAYEGFTPLSDHINWPNISNCNIGEAIAEVAKACHSSFEASSLWKNDRSRGPFRSGYAKCNLFVAEVLANIGIYASSRGESGWRQVTLRIPTSADWAHDRVPSFHEVEKRIEIVDLDFFMRSFLPVPAQRYIRRNPRPGCIVAQKYDYADATGHVAIVVGNRESIGTSSYYGGKLVRNDFGFRTNQESKDAPCGGHMDDVVYLEHRDATSRLDTIIPDDILNCLQY